MRDLPRLAALLEEVGTDYHAWITTYRCKSCGAIWEERYRQGGHGEVPDVVRCDDG